MLGLVQHGAALKLFVLGALVVRVVLPIEQGDGFGGWAMLWGGLIAFAVAVGVVESVMARLPLRRVPGLLIAACLSSGFGMVLLAR
jgi:formate hydrogenlyase subunit 4